MRVLKVELDGVTTSFRHPHFLTGRQPSYPMPPPATIYGHIAGALGSFPDPGGLRFAYSFHSVGRVDDMENIYLVTLGGSVPREAKTKWPYVVNTEAVMNPVLREMLFQPHLTLYIDAPGMLNDLYAAFRSPRYIVVLGRSQDLASYRSVDLIETEEAESGYAEGTLLPHSERERFQNVVTMMMPRFVDPEHRRDVVWSPYLILERRAFLVPSGQAAGNGSAWTPTRVGERFDVDMESPVVGGGQRILWWQNFVADGEMSVAMAANPH